MPTTDVFCAATGALPDDADFPGDHPLEDEELSDLPVGWTRITLQTRTPNPVWQEILAVEEAMVAQVVQGIPKNQRKQAVVGVRVQVAAQLAALKSQTPPFTVETEVAHIGPSEDAAKTLAELKAMLGLVEGEVSDDASTDDEQAGDAADDAEGGEAE
jgi:hypothetical protein